MSRADRAGFVAFLAALLLTASLVRQITSLGGLGFAGLVWAWLEYRQDRREARARQDALRNRLYPVLSWQRMNDGKLLVFFEDGAVIRDATFELGGVRPLRHEGRVARFPQAEVVGEGCPWERVEWGSRAEITGYEEPSY